MLDVKWDNSLPSPVKECRTRRWDEWFASVADEEASRAWAAAKSVHTDSGVLDGWASIIELDRLSRSSEDKKKTPT